MRCTKRIMGAALLGCSFILPIQAQEKESGAADLNAKVTQALESLLSDPRQSARITFGEADKMAAALTDAFPGAKKYELLELAYKALKPQVTQQPEHALKARLLAALARTSRQRANDIADAEQLDLLLNPDQPDAWLRRGISYAKMKEEKYAADMFLEALRRTDFARPPEFFDSLAPPTAGWVARVARAKRTDELNSALADAFARTKRGAASPMAFTMLQAVLDVDDTPQQPQRLALMLKSVREHQQHLLISHMAQFHKRVASWQQTGHQDAAAAMARALLLTPMQEGETSPPPVETGGETASQQRAHHSIDGKQPGEAVSNDADLDLALWGKASANVETEGIIRSLIYSALREPNADFLAEADEVARRHPQDVHLVSSVLLTKAVVSSVTEETLQLAQGLDPISRLQVAWRLVVLAPPERVEPRLLVPWCTEGIASLMRSQDVKGHAGGGARQIMRWIPWLEQAGQNSSLTSLVPELRQRLVQESGMRNGDQNRDLWPSLLALAARYGSDEEANACAEAWRKNLAHRTVPIEEEWNECRHAVGVLVSSMSQVPRKRCKYLALLAFESWGALWSRSLKQGHSDGAAATLVLHALMSTDLREELATFEGQIVKEITFGRDALYEPILKKLRWYQQATSADGSFIPHASVRVLEPGPAGEEPRIAWSFAPPPDITERLRLAFLMGDNDSFRRDYAPPLLHALSERYDLEVYAGESTETWRMVGSAKAVAVEGELALKDLPPGGWLRMVTRDTHSGGVVFGEPQVYCIRQPEMDSRPQQNPPPLQWGANLVDDFGTPASQPMLIEPDTEYLLRVDVPDNPRGVQQDMAATSVSLVALDENKHPIGQVYDLMSTSLTQGVGRFMGLIRPDRWWCRNGDLREVRDSEEWEGAVKPRYLLLTYTTRAPNAWPVRVQKFRRYKSTPVPEKLPEVKADFLALIDMEARTWFVSNIRPRAAVGGPGSIKVYDTSVTPWRLLRHLDSRALVGRESVFLFRDDVLLCVEWPCEGRPDAALRVVPLESDSAYEAHERRVLPMNPLRSEVAVDESGVIFTAPSEGPFRTKFRALWLGADGTLLEATAERPPVEGTSEIAVVWWGKGGSVGISEGGRMFQLKVLPEALAVEKQEPGVASFESVPPEAEPSSHLWQPRFVLKDGRLLLRLDQKTGEVIAGYRLPYVCRGSVIWMADEHSPALLVTDQGELIRANVPPLHGE